ncbi:MFS general substrate transporter [Cylindrobasidium torrendii FP15055 ss-10]|uniref:MFS general substrate transporter n=1 Tax=Cylindrobasidium torrendii FP15055 ss-10 TaxID=1314674 RepID=A0A0D7B8H0_9AGAR|nr:MFS general substrate transporter [Cylindrobasidium torrendii FP15055 ss-10]
MSKPITEVEERHLVRKLDSYILPMTCLLYLFAYLDRSNLGNARLQGLPEDVLGGDESGYYFDWVNSAFFFSYILFQIPASIASKMFPPHFWIASAAVGWGLASTLMATAFNFGGLVSARVFMGLFEGCFGPGIPLYYSLFYTKHEMGLRMAYWFGFAAVAGAFGGLIAFGVNQIESSISNWRLLFIIEGIPAVILGVLTVALLPNRPERTKLLTEREREIALHRMHKVARGDVGYTVNRAHIWMAFKDWRVYTGGVIFFGLNCALASISAFLPTIIKTFGYTDALAQLMTVPPYAVAAVVMSMVSYVTDRLQTRGLFMAGSSCIGAIGYIILLTVEDNNGARYFATFCLTTGTYTSIGIIIAWYAHNLGSETKKATGIPMFMAIGQCGSILGSHIYPKADGPKYTRGFAICCALELLAALCCVFLHVSYKWDNARRDSLHGKPDPDVSVDTRELADKAPNFRYMG